MKKILWQLDADTPLEDSEASRFDGVTGDIVRVVDLDVGHMLLTCHPESVVRILLDAAEGVRA